MQKKLFWYALIVLLIVIITSLFIFSPFISNFIVLNKIYYRIVYETDIPDSDDIIDKVETFEYHQYLKMHDYYGETLDISKFNQSMPQYNYINRDYINYVKDKINQDRKKLHLWPFYSHYFNYIFNATEQAKLYFCYSNTTIFNATYENNNAAFVVEYDEYYDNFIGNWYINSTYVPSVSSQPFTLPLNNTILIRMFIDYDHVYGNLGAETYHIRQYIALSSDLQIIFVYIPLVSIVVA